MKFIKNNKEKEVVICELTHDNLRIFMSVIGAVFSQVPVYDFEFTTRLGATKEEINKISDEIWHILEKNDIDL